jgi:hypothetical protein
MEALEFLKSKIAGFPGYARDDDRRRSDELVRSYLGEALADLEKCLGSSTDSTLAQKAGDLLIRVAFTNQHAYKAYENAARTNGDFDAMAAADASTVEVADRAASTDAPGFGTYLDEAAAALDRRDACMSGATVVAAP